MMTEVISCRASKTIWAWSNSSRAFDLVWFEETEHRGKRSRKVLCFSHDSKRTNRIAWGLSGAAIVGQGEESLFFSILADECRDIVKTWLRSTMPNERLSCLTLMHLNYNLEIPYEELIQKWAQQKHRLIHVDIHDWLSELQIAVSLLIFNTYPPPSCNDNISHQCVALKTLPNLLGDSNKWHEHCSPSFFIFFLKNYTLYSPKTPKKSGGRCPPNPPPGGHCPPGPPVGGCTTKPHIPIHRHL